MGPIEGTLIFKIDRALVHVYGLPGCISAFCPGLQAALALPFGGFGAALAGGLGSRPMIQRRIPPQARDHGHLVFDAGQGQRDRRKAAIDH